MHSVIKSVKRDEFEQNYRVIYAVKRVRNVRADDVSSIKVKVCS